MSVANEAFDFGRISGIFFRIVFAQDEYNLLQGAASAQGRYHYDRQAALYMSSKAEWAWKAIDVYVRAGDPPRLLKRLRVSEANVVDTRNRDMCRKLGIVPGDSDIPWQPQLEAGLRPNTWDVSDKARVAGADGLVYTARSAPERWHLVLFRWNQHGGPKVMAE